MSEAAYSVTEKNAKGNLCTVRGNNYAEFHENITALFQGNVTDAEAYLDGFRAAFGVAPITPQQAVANVQAAFPGTTNVVPMPGVPQAAATPASPVADVAPPTGGGNCAHGPRQYKESTPKTGPNAGNLWRRWECAIPWSRDVQGRCPQVNVR